MATAVADTYTAASGATLYAGIVFGGGGDAAEAITISGPFGGAPDVASLNFTVGADGTISGTVVVTPSDAGAGGTFTPTSVSISSGTPTATFTYTPDEAGVATITVTNNGGLDNPASRTYTASDPVAAGAWQLLSNAGIMLRPVSAPGAITPEFDPANAIDADDTPPVFTTTLPYHSFCRTVPTWPGMAELSGGMHSNYAGNETYKFVNYNLDSTVFGVSINHQPTIPPNGPGSGYAAGSGSYVYRQYGTPLADPSMWQPYAVHEWCFSAFAPLVGRLYYVAYAVDDGAMLGPNPLGEGTQYPQSSEDIYPAPDVRAKAFCTYNWTTGKYTKVIDSPGTDLGNYPVSGISDYCAFRQSNIVLCCNQYQLYVFDLANNPLQWHLTATFNLADIMPDTTDGRWDYGKDGNGILILPLEESQFLVFTSGPQSPPAHTMEEINFRNQVFKLDLAGTPTMTRVYLTGELLSDLQAMGPTGDGSLSFSVEKASRSVYAIIINGSLNVSNGIFTGQPKIFRASFDDLETMVPLVTTGAPTVSHNFGYDRRPFITNYNGWGWLYTGSDGAGLTVHRVKLHQGNYEAPAIEWVQHDSRTQGFLTAAPVLGSIMKGKHANAVWNTAEGKWYLIGGDFEHSAAQTIVTLTADYDGSYEFETVLNETDIAPPGFVRPASTDDGAAAYVQPGNSNEAIAGKIIYFRGGEGFGLVTNQYNHETYDAPEGGDPDYESKLAIAEAAALADRWTMAKAVILNPATMRFTDAEIETWPVESGTFPSGHPGEWNGQTTRCGVWDEATNTMFKFATNMLVAFQFNTQTIRIWTWGSYNLDGTPIIMTHVKSPDPAWIHASGLYWTDPGDPSRNNHHFDPKWEHQGLALDSATGKLYVFSTGTGLMWCFETRGTETTTGEGWLTIPYYPVGERMPFSRVHFLGAENGGWDVSMHSYAAFVDGGIQYICDDRNGNFGTARQSFYRKLSDTGPWTPYTLPPNFACNTVAAKFPNDINNTEFLALRGHAGVESPFVLVSHAFFSGRVRT